LISLQKVPFRATLWGLEIRHRRNIH
jgi:hypothetical protein